MITPEDVIEILRKTPSANKTKGFKEIYAMFPDFRWSQALYHYAYSLNEIPKCECGREAKFYGFSKGYSQFCPNSKCPYRRKSIQEKMRKTTLEKYGVEYYSKTEDFHISYRNTCMEKYGVEHTALLQSTKDKIKETNREKYGVDYVFESPEIMDKIRETNLERYGVENPMQHEAFKEKQKNTMLERYGVENPSQYPEFLEKVRSTWLRNWGVDHPHKNKIVMDRSIQTFRLNYGCDNPNKTKEVRDKIASTNIERYGAVSPSQNEEIREKIKKTLIERYGVDNPSKLPEIAKKQKTSFWKNYLEFNKDILTFVTLNDEDYLKIGDPIRFKECGHESNYIGTNGPKSERCRVCFPPMNGVSKGEKEVLDFIKTKYDGAIIPNDRSVLNGYELDIYLPELNFAIEYNGLYYHSSPSLEDEESFIHKHFGKTMGCANKGVALLHITDYEWANKREIVESMICRYICASRLVFADACTVREVCIEDAHEFLEKNDISGSFRLDKSYGLYDGDELVFLMATDGASIKRLTHKNGVKVQFGELKISELFGIETLLYVHDAQRPIEFDFELVQVVVVSHKWTNGKRFLEEGDYDSGHRKYFDCGSILFKPI